MGTLGWILSLAMLNGALLTVLLLTARGNRAANRFLALLVGAISLRLLIYILGFAGLYDTQRWLVFAPLDASLAFGPALWLYVATLTSGRPPARWRWHLLPAAMQLGYAAVAFCLPVEVKWRWYGGPHLAIVEPAALAALLLSCAGYLVAAWRRLRDFERWLRARPADRRAWRLGWLRAILPAFAAALCVALAAALRDRLIAPLDYLGRVPVVFASSLLAYALGLIGWRHAGLTPPAQDAATTAAANPSVDMVARVAGWRERMIRERWWRDEQLTLGELARRLGVSERTLSRGLREGAGCNFNAFVNGLRVEAVQRSIATGDGRDLLTLALAEGFASKASFNRAFRRQAGTSPSAWRAAQISPIAQAAAI